MSGRYTPYISIRENLASLLRKSTGLPKHLKGEKMMDEAVKQYLHVPGASMNFTSGILIDEEDYSSRDCRVYFPVNSELLQMLWRAKMDVSPDDLGEFPRTFSVAWPDDFSIDDVKFHGCLVWFAKERERIQAHAHFGKKYFDNEKMERWNPKEEKHDPDGWMLAMSYNVPDRDFGLASYRCVIPGKLLTACLQSPDDMEKSIGSLGGFFTLSLTPEERRQQFMMLKMIMHLMVYMTACPNAVVAGWPDKFHQRDVGKGFIKKFKPVVLESPVMPRQGSSPCTHWRTWHFRRYPVKQDGSRKNGVLFVSGCIVSGKVDPRTVLQSA